MGVLLDLELGRSLDSAALGCFVVETLVVSLALVEVVAGKMAATEDG